MGRLSFFGNFAAIFLITVGIIGAVNVDKQSFLTDIFLIVVALGPVLMFSSIILGIISIIKNKQRGFGIAGLITGVFFAGMFCIFVYFALIGLAGFR